MNLLTSFLVVYWTRFTNRLQHCWPRACIDALSFVLIFLHISATISEEAPCRMEFSCPPGIIENYRENT